MTLRAAFLANLSDQVEANTEYLMLDSTSVPAHQQAADAMNVDSA